MTKWKIPLYRIASDEEDVKSVSKVILRGTDWAIGKEITEFEELMADYVGTKYCLMFNSGTSALHAGLLAMGVDYRHEVIIPSFTFIATANSVLMVNAKPRFVDIENETYGLDPHLIGSSINKKSKMIIPVHYAGLACKIEEIKEIARERKIILFEDAAESLGSKIHNKKVGTFGDLSMFSFAGNKVLTTGEGGCITTNSKQIFEKLKLIRSHGRIDKQNYFSSILKPEYVAIGFNWRMSSITAALGISQLHKLEKLIDLRRKHAKYLTLRLSNLKQIKTPIEPSGYRHIYQLYSIRLPNLVMRNKLMKFLTKKGIMSKVFFDPIHETKFYKKMLIQKKNYLNTTKSVSEQILTLPMFPGLKKEELDYICDSIKEFMENT